MADRHRLHISKLDDFKEWLVKDGWDIEEPKGTWEVLRARKSGRKNPLIVYTKIDAKEHLSVMDRDSGVIGAFLRDSNKPKTNADKIRAMNDEELAEFLEEIKNGEVLELCADFKDGCWYSCKLHHACDEETSKLYLQWLQSEAE